MGVEVYIVAENLSLEIQDGKSLAKALDDLDGLAKALKLKPFSEFMSGDLETYCSVLGVPDELRNEETYLYDEVAVTAWLEEKGLSPVTAESWFLPEEGQETVSGLLKHLRQDPTGVPDSEEAIEALDACLTTLDELVASGTRWHLAVDF